MRAQAYISLGANLALKEGLEPERNLDLALEMLGKRQDLRLEAISRRYLTQPQDRIEQPWFVNQTAGLSTELTPEELLLVMRHIETVLGRDRKKEKRFGQRTIDLDLLLFGNIIMETQVLTLPHPRMRQRAFVLIPLAEIAPGLILPDGESLERAVENLKLENQRLIPLNQGCPKI